MVTFFDRKLACVAIAGAVALAACGSGGTNIFVGDGGVDAGQGDVGIGGSAAAGAQGGAGGGGSGGDASVEVCASDEQCTGTRPLCNPGSGMCVQCRTSADCGSDAECRDSSCAPFSACINSLDCAPGDVCDTQASRCVDCLSDVDCSAGEQCESQVCRPACDSDLDCTPLGLLCDRVNGYCVRCLSHVDCSALQFCRDGTCVNDVCRPDSTACVGNGTAVCTPEGDAYGAATPCPLGQICLESGGSAVCETTGDDVLLIDDMEDGDQYILGLAGRHGYWWASNDGTGVQSPSPSDTYIPELLELPRAASSRAIHATGGGFSVWGAVIKLDFNNTASGIGGGIGAPGTYDVRGYNGITFYARGTGSLRVEARTTATVLVAEGGACLTACNDHYGKNFPVLSSTWAVYTMAWSEVLPRGFTGTAPWAPEAAIGVQFMPSSLSSFEVWIDDVRFY